MPELLLQKSSKSSKSKARLEALTRRLSLWTEGRVYEAVYGVQIIHDCFKIPDNATNIAKTSRKFKVLNSKGNVNGALKLLANIMSNGILPLSNKTLELLKHKHPEPMEFSPEKLL